jgi:hypothetical protein
LPRSIASSRRLQMGFGRRSGRRASSTTVLRKRASLVGPKLTPLPGGLSTEKKFKVNPLRFQSCLEPSSARSQPSAASISALWRYSLSPTLAGPSDVSVRRGLSARAARRPQAPTPYALRADQRNARRRASEGTCSVSSQQRPLTFIGRSLRKRARRRPRLSKVVHFDTRLRGHRDDRSRWECSNVVRVWRADDDRSGEQRVLLDPGYERSRGL